MVCMNGAVTQKDMEDWRMLAGIQVIKSFCKTIVEVFYSEMRVLRDFLWGVNENL